MKDVRVKLVGTDGKPKSFTLAFGTKALRRFERESEVGISDLSKRFGVDTIACLLYAGMVYYHPEVTMDDIDDMLDTFLEKGGDIEPMMTVITDAVTTSGWFANPTKAAASTSGSGEKPAE